MSKLWLVKDKKGRIFGPYNEQEICFYLDEREFKGEELFSSYPAGKWRPLSAHPVFYERILARLNKKKNPSSPSEKSLSSDQLSSALGGSRETIEPTRIVSPETASVDSKKKPAKKGKKVKIKLSKEFKEDVLAEEGASEIIEMEDQEGKLFDKLKSSLKLPALAFILLLAALAFVFLGQDKKGQILNRARLMSAGSANKPLPVEKLKAEMKRGISSYYKGTVSNYLKAQASYVRVLEAKPDKKEIYLYLCLAYLELWPFAYQDSRDKKALALTLDQASKKDRGGIFSGLCKSAQALINKKPRQSLMLANTSLNNLPNKHFSTVFFYYIKARALMAQKKPGEANKYFQYAYELSPKWTAPRMLSGNIFYESGQYGLAAREYQKALSVFPQHISAGLRLGVLEYKHFKKPKNSEARLKSILANLNGLAEPNILTEAYVALSHIYLNQGNKKEALRQANKAYALDPENPDVVFLKSKFAEDSAFGGRLEAWGLIYKGDMLAGQENCSEAQKYFKKAWRAGAPKGRSLASFKMAQCYWKSGASGQAIRWLKRSINADSDMQEAYFLLSDYLSDLYDFESAKDILSAVRGKNPSNYDLFKAYARLAFRQGDYKSAAAYAERALKFYTADVEIYILLSKIHFALGKGHKAFSYAEKAEQEDPNSVQAQIAYALALNLAYGHQRAKSYFDKLIEHFPLVAEYSQALGEYYFDKGMYDEALAQFLLTASRHPKFKPVYIYLGRIYSYLSAKSRGEKSRGEYEQALKYLLEAVFLDSSDPEPLFYIGQAHLQNEQYQLAENEFEKILRMNSNYPLIQYYIGLVNFLSARGQGFGKSSKICPGGNGENPQSFFVLQAGRRHL